MSTSTRFLGRFGELHLYHQVLTIVSFTVASLVFGMVAANGYFWPMPVGIVLGVLVGMVVAWSVASLLGE